MVFALRARLSALVRPGSAHAARPSAGGLEAAARGAQADLLPRGADAAAVTQWLLATAAHKRLTAFHAHLVSSRTGEARPGAARVLGRPLSRGRQERPMGDRSGHEPGLPHPAFEAGFVSRM